WSRTGEFKDKGLNPGQFAWMYQGIESVETPDPYTAVIHFSQPFAPFINYTASNYNPIVSREIYEEDGHLKDRIVGTGPWQLDPAASQKGTRWVWKKHAGYWDSGKPYLDEVRWLVIPDNAAALAAFQARQVDHLARTALNFRAVDDLKKAVPQAQTMKYSQPFGNHLFINNRQKPLDDVRVRRAISLAIDRDELAMADQGEKAPWALPGAISGLFTDAEARQLIKYDPVEAKRLLAEAGFPNGIEIPWEYPGQHYGQGYVTRLELLQAQFKKAGINMALKNLENTDYITRRRAGNSLVSLASVYCGTSDDIDAHIYACYHSKSKQAYMFINDPEMDRLLEAQRQEPDPEKRREALRNAVKRLTEQAYGVATYYPSHFEAWQPHVKSYMPNLSGWFGGSRWDSVWLDK
ncbi:MAG: hypothetical protein GEU28_14375, partial [Dehalococcoidia bacterium]|nr:hypothetical protein [Dehalococcoidia bacterium]